MQYRKFPRIPGIESSLLGLGFMRLPMDAAGKSIDEEKSMALVDAALKQGVNYFDTAWPYHDGKSEPFVGRALKRFDARDKIILATKSPVWLMEKEADWEGYLDKQLKRLEVEKIDFYLFHALNAGSWQKVLDLNGLKAFERARADGRIGHIGFSFHDGYPAFEKIVNGYDWEFCQVQYNYFDENDQATRKGVELAAGKGIGVVVMEPLRGGGLAKTVPQEVRRVFASYSKPRMPAEWALRWIFDQSAVSTVLSGMGSVDELLENAAVASSQAAGSMSAQEKGIIEGARVAFKSRIVVPCTGCRYCMPCPQGVDIPWIFELRNSASIFDDVGGPGWGYKFQVMPNKSADRCVSCGACEAKCPQKIKIMDALHEAHELLRKRKSPAKKKADGKNVAEKKKAPVKTKASSVKASVKKAPSVKVSATKDSAKKAPTKKAPAKKALAKKPSARKAPTKASEKKVSKKKIPAKKAQAKKVTAKK
jgi:uncharacterized protein